jgi:uncharacterized protein YbjT (DUF2867 family)
MGLRVLVQGATGSVGGEVVRECLADSRFDRVIAITRRPLAIEDERLEVVTLEDFTDVSKLDGMLGAIDACFCALGISQMQEPDPARYRVITYDYVLTLARALDAKNPKAKFVFVSGGGADPSGKSRMLFARVKGEAEKDLRTLYGDRLTIVRPALIRPIRPREKTPWFEHVIMPIGNLLAPIGKSWTSTTVEIAHAMMQSAIDGEARPDPLENRDIVRLAEAVFVKSPRS